MKGVVKWYLSGFYKKPQGLKKPYNPLLGETFRCYWQHPNGSRTFYLAEQVVFYLWLYLSLDAFPSFSCAPFARLSIHRSPTTRRSRAFT